MDVYLGGMSFLYSLGLAEAGLLHQMGTASSHSMAMICTPGPFQLFKA